jgi:hypothetical protein
MDSIPLINICYDLYKHIILINNDLDKRTKYSLGIKIEQNFLECLENIIMATNSMKPHKSLFILKAISKNDILRLQLRMIIDLKLIPPEKRLTKIIQAQTNILEIGKMLGGWLKVSYTTK